MELVTGSLMALEDTDAFIGAPEPYAHGHVDTGSADLNETA